MAHSSPLPLLLAASALALTSCKKPEAAATAEPAPATSATAPIAVQLATVEARKAPQVLDLSGTLGPDEQADLVANVPAVVVKVNVDVGDRVKAGQVLITLDGRDAALRLAAARAQERQQRAYLGMTAGEGFDPAKVPDVRAAREADLLAQREVQRTNSLFAAGVISSSDAEHSKAQAEQARAMYDKSMNGAKQAYAGLGAARAQAGLSAKALADTKIVAPFDGAVAERRVSPGDFAGMGVVVVVVVSDDPLRLKVPVPEPMVRYLRLDAEVTVLPTALPGQAFTGKVKRIGAALDSLSRSLPIEIEVPNPDRQLRAGYFARAMIATPDSLADVLTVPAAALSQGATSQRLFVRVGSKVEERLVVVGRSFDDRVEVTGKLSAGDQVVLSPPPGLGDGDAVSAP